MTSVSSRRIDRCARVIGLSALLVGCVTGPAGQVPRSLTGAAPGELRIEDERGPIGAPRAEALLQKLERDGDEGRLLARHLAQVEAVTTAPLVLGNEAHLLVDGPDTKEAMFRAIAAAQRSIDLETYILEQEGAGERLLELFEERRAQGVEVRVVYDSVGSLGTEESYFDQLRALGVAVCEFNPVNPLQLSKDKRLTINNRNHRKVLVVDGQVAFTGGINISSVYSSSSPGSSASSPDPRTGWRDTHVEVRGPVVAHFQNLFDGSWRDQRCEPVMAARTASPPERAGAMVMRLVAADPASGRSELYVALLSALEHASQRVWLTNGYFVPDQNLVEALAAAARRGVDVRLVLPGFSDFWAPFHAGRSHYTTLLRAGVRLFERRDAVLHAKTAVIDGVWASVGSTNLDWRSFVHNYEADILVLDSGFAKELEALFSEDVEASHEILAEDWKRRGIGPRFLEWFARRWEYLL